MSFKNEVRASAPLAYWRLDDPAGPDFAANEVAAAAPMWIARTVLPGEATAENDGLSAATFAPV